MRVLVSETFFLVCNYLPVVVATEALLLLKIPFQSTLFWDIFTKKKINYF